MVGKYDRAVLEEYILDGLAAVQDRPVAEVRTELQTAGGGLAIDSKEAECVLDEVEHRLGLGPLATGDELAPEQLTTFDALTGLILHGLGRKEAT